MNWNYRNRSCDIDNIQHHLECQSFCSNIDDLHDLHDDVINKNRNLILHNLLTANDKSNLDKLSKDIEYYYKNINDSIEMSWKVNNDEYKSIIKCYNCGSCMHRVFDNSDFFKYECTKCGRIEYL